MVRRLVDPSWGDNGDTSNFVDNSGSSSAPETSYNPSPITVNLRNTGAGTLRNSGSLTNRHWEEHTIKIKVTLYHNGTAYDMTPYIVQIKTSMALGQASGRFTILTSFQKRWDLLVQAQDYIEIRFSRYLPKPPVIMRGFVSNVRRTRIVDESGKLHRGITINGYNFGKIWDSYNIQYLVQEPGQLLAGSDVNPSVNPLMEPMLMEDYGIGNGSGDSTISNADLMQAIIDKMLNPQIKVLQTLNPKIPLLKSNIKVLPDYQITNLMIQQYLGSVYSFLEQFGNKPFCEWFIDDFEDAPVVIYRNAPFKTVNGEIVMQESLPDMTYYQHVYISDVDIIQEDVGFTDQETYSYFFTYPAQQVNLQTDPKAAILGSQPNLTIEQESDTNNITNPHVDLDNLYRFGFKDLQVASNSISVADDQAFIATALKMNRFLVRAFNWTHLMLNGTFRIKGNEHMRIGRYFTNTSTNEEYYIESVDHEITLTQMDSLGNDGVYRFETTVGVTRGRRLS
jgi:hypothetical protein